MQPAAYRIRALCEIPELMARPLPTAGRHARIVIGVGVLAAVAVAVAASPLPRLTPDSASYLTGAERLASDGRFESCTGPITLFAPGYSAALAPLVSLGLDAPDAARLVNALATLALVLGAGFLARAARLPEVAVLLVAVGVALSYATLRNGALVWSEPLFCAILAWLLALAVDRGRGLELRVSPRLLGIVVLAWALLLTRHSGVFVLPAVVLAGWLGSASARGRLARVVAFAVALVAVPAAWWARNVDIDGDPFGRRSESRYSLADVLEQLPDGLGSLALPTALPLALRLAVAVPLLVAAGLAWRRRPESAGSHIAVAVLTTAVVVYVVAVTAAAARTVVDPIDTRLLSPIVAPTAVLVALGVSWRRTLLERGLAVFALVVVAAMALLAPGVVWRGHGAERSLANVPEDVSCAEWPSRYSGAAIRLARDRG
jgi:hypothetical protein